MSHFLRRIQRQFLSYQKSDRNALIILGSILFIVILANRLLPVIMKPSANDFSEIEALVEQWEEEKAATNPNPNTVLFEFDPNLIAEEKLDSLNLPYFIKNNILSYRKAGGKFQSPEDLRKIYGMNDSVFEAVRNYIVIQKQEFSNTSKSIGKEIKTKKFRGAIDPNRVSYDRLINFGFDEFHAKNIVNFREGGGKFLSAEDLMKVYGIDSSVFIEVRDHIIIDHNAAVSKNELIEIKQIELNGADTSVLKTLPGVGPVYASRIVKYRNLLGGFYNSQQLLEVYNFPVETYNTISGYLTVDTIKLKKLRVNFLEYSDLLRHPYLNKEQVNELIKVRETNGPFKNLSEIEVLKTFNTESFERVKPYLSCR